MRPDAAFYHRELNEFILPYEAVRTADSPEAAIRAFVESTYEQAADLAEVGSPSPGTCAGSGRTTMTDQSCAHIAAVTTVKHPKRRECEECVKIGASWVHLRTCQECGVTLCCDNSPNRHATKHAKATAHPVIASAEPGERWLYCYPDDAFAEY